MNRLNIVFLFGAVCLLVAPALTLPTDGEFSQKMELRTFQIILILTKTNSCFKFIASEAEATTTEAAKEETTTDAGRDVDDDYPITKAPTLSGGESGVIRRVGVKGPCMYMNLNHSNWNANSDQKI